MKKKIFIILVALVFFIGGTYALIRKTVFNQNAGFSISGLDAYIIYNKGTDVLTGTLMDTENYSDSTLNTEITLYKNASFDIYGHIYLDLKAIGTNLSQEKALKWVITSNNEVLNSGSFIGYSINDSIPLALNIPLSTTEQKFQIYIWLDENELENFDISNEQIGVTVRAEATQIPLKDEPNAPELVDGLIPVMYKETKCSDISNLTYQDYPECYDVSYNYDNLSQEDITKLEEFCVAANLGTAESCPGIVSQILNDGGYDIDGFTLTKLMFLDVYVNRFNGDPVGEEVIEYNQNNVYSGEWVKADNTNSSSQYKWYDYDNKMWANAVLVSSTNRNTYMNANAGTSIPEEDVLAYYVWIPRYKYKVWNINKTVGVDSYNAQTTGIDIVFEKGTRSTGTVSCNYNFAITDGSLSEICAGNNGDYYTHPAFTFGDKEVTGFWVGKFEISSENPSASNGGDNVTNLTVRVKPNVASWRNNTVTNFWKVIYDMQIENNIYGLNTSRTSTDSHMLKNMEWGAIAYLTNSKYGRCTNNTCTEVTINNSSDYITGNAGNTVSATEASGVTNAYNTAKGQLASTTGNIYGVYDMSGGAYEFVMGNMSSAAGSYTYYASSGGSNYTYTGNEKYINTYSYGTLNNNQTAYNRARLGDATSESKSWYYDIDSFVYSTKSWFYRGGYYSDTTDAGPFSFYSVSGNTYNNYSARASLFAMTSN